METTKNEMSEYAKNFFNKLSNYLGEKIYFYGSIQRNDYFHNSSDIDVDIFTENTSSTIIKIQNFLNLEKSDLKKIIFKPHHHDSIVKGYKIRYKDKEHNFKTDISIYDNIYKDVILHDHTRKFILPYYVSILLIILKFLYYRLSVIPKDIYKNIKDFLVDNCVDGTKDNFVIL